LPVVGGFIYKGKFEGAKPLQQPLFPLSFEGEGDKGGEVDKQSLRSKVISLMVSML